MGVESVDAVVSLEDEPGRVVGEGSVDTLVDDGRGEEKLVALVAPSEKVGSSVMEDCTPSEHVGSPSDDGIG